MSESDVPSRVDHELPRRAYVLIGLSFIPGIGVLFGIIAVIWGLLTSKFRGRRLVALGLTGICIACIPHGILYYLGFVKKDGFFAEANRSFTQRNLNSLVLGIEYYKIQHGYYPESLKDLREFSATTGSLDIYEHWSLGPRAKPTPFFYQRVGSDHYYLRAVGPDRAPFTADDIAPSLPKAEAAMTGLLLEGTTPRPTP